MHLRPRFLRPSARHLRSVTLALLLALATSFAGCAATADPAATTDTASAASTSAPAVEVEPSTGAAGAAAVPHVHDYWAGRERVTLLQQDVTVEAPTALVWGALTTRYLGEPSFGGAFVELPEGSIVYEGTGRMEITLTWSDPGITGMRFLHRHAGSGEVKPWIETPNGETVTLDVTPAMTDMPHAQASRWVFLFAASGTPAVAVGTFHVQMDIVKMRDVAEWPAHPDLWASQPSLRVADAEGHSSAHVAPTELLARDPWAEPEDAIVATALVPMETATLRVDVTVLASDPNVEFDRLHLLVRDAGDVAFDFDHAGEPASISDDGATWTWELPVDMDQTDNPYADTSAWAFRVVAGTSDAGIPVCDEGCYHTELRYHLTATAEKADATVA